MDVAHRKIVTNHVIHASYKNVPCCCGPIDETTFNVEGGDLQKALLQFALQTERPVKLPVGSSIPASSPPPVSGFNGDRRNLPLAQPIIIGEESKQNKPVELFKPESLKKTSGK